MISLVYLNRQHDAIMGELNAAIQEVLARGQFILGPQVEAFEREFAAYCGVAEAGGGSSGTEALRLALLACGLQPGDEIIVPSFTAVPTVAAVLAAGGRPVLAEIDPSTYTLDPEHAAPLVSPQTQAIFPVPLYGHTADMIPSWSWRLSTTSKLSKTPAKPTD